MLKQLFSQSADSVQWLHSLRPKFFDFFDIGTSFR